MNATLISAITDFTLAARDLLTREAGEQLEGIFGWLPDGTFGEAKRYPALATLPEAAETRRRLELYTREETEAGVVPSVAREKLKREAAFTWLNRAAAFRLLEERKLIKPTLARLHKSNGYVFWLTTDGNEANLALHEQGTLPLNLMGEGPADVAYRHWLLAQCEAQSAQVSVLFDPGTLATRLCPRPAALRQVVESMNADALAPAWHAGNEETVGWLYEGFIEDENAVVFEKFSKGKKVLPSEIGAATQRFTPRWIVEFLIQNSLGRLWLEMHPDSRLGRSMAYLVPVEGTGKRALKAVKEITFLDPSCGSMHFGLIAFDLFAEMYREERERAGQPGWPKLSSVDTEDAIPGAILESNLHGIDIDLRAVQVSALALLLRAKTLNPKTVATDANLACANVEQLTGGQLEEFIKQTKFSHPIYERTLRRVGSRLKESEHLGSLLRIEKEIEQLVSSERNQSTSIFSELPGLHPEQFSTQEGVEEFYGMLTEQIGQHLDHFVQSSRNAGKDGGLFATEAAKGLRFLRLVERRYDVVATNPPYMSGRNMSDIMGRYLTEAYKPSKGDLYAAFITRCVELTDSHGLVAMITQQSFMFISSYEDMREELRSNAYITSMAHLGSKAFPNIAGEKVNTAAFVLRKENDAKKRESQVGTYFRLVKERDAEGKRLAFEAAVAARRKGEAHPQVFTYKQGDFDAIPYRPWVYWIPKSISQLFIDLPPLSKMAGVREGINTGDNTRFIRYFWEVPTTSLGRDRKWMRFAKGNKSKRYHYPMEKVALADTNEMRQLSGARIFGLENIGREGLSFLSNTPKRMCAWHTPSEHMFCSTGGRTIFPHDNDSLFWLLGIVNSSLAAYLVRCINNTISVKVGDLMVLPVPKIRDEILSEKTIYALNITAMRNAADERSYGFNRPLRRLEEIDGLVTRLDDLERDIDREVSRLYGLTENDLNSIEQEVVSELALSNSTSEDDSEADADDDDSPEVPTNNSSILARNWTSYAIGAVLGRFAIGETNGLGCGDFTPEQVKAIRALIDADGVMPCEKGHPQDLAARAAACLGLMLGDDAARDTIRTATGETGDPSDALRTWLDRFTGTPEKSFWKYHHQLYRKRPIYWPLQSPDKHFTVWVFQERFTKETLFTVKKLAEDQHNLLQRRAADLRPEATTHRAKAKALDAVLEQVDDLAEFIKRIEAITQRGYTPCIDDGVLLNAAPLFTLLPSWPETKKAWQELDAAKYEWAHQAMLHWPERVKAACHTNKSFAIAHGLA